ncbi:polymer-forming cytoskeletal protein [Shewanella sp. A14]
MNNKNKGITYIGVDMLLNGHMNIQGPAMIAGQTKGRIDSTDHIKIEPGGEVDGEVFCQEIRVAGLLKGKLQCNKLVITSSGIVEGEVSSHQMEIYDGGQFIGMRTKGPDASILPQIDPERFANQSHAALESDTKVSSRKWLYVAAAAIVIILGIVFQPQINLILNRFNSQASENVQRDAVMSQQPISNVTEENAATLLQDMDQQASFVEQAEELLNAGQSDIDMAMEDLDALAITNEALGDGNADSVEQNEPSAASSEH